MSKSLTLLKSTDLLTSIHFATLCFDPFNFGDASPADDDDDDDAEEEEEEDDEADGAGADMTRDDKQRVIVLNEE